MTDTEQDFFARRLPEARRFPISQELDSRAMHRPSILADADEILLALERHRAVTEVPVIVPQNAFTPSIVAAPDVSAQPDDPLALAREAASSMNDMRAGLNATNSQFGVAS